MTKIDPKLIENVLNGLGKETPKEILESYSINPESIKRKPKYLKSDLAEKIKSIGSIYRDIYESIDNNIDRLNEVEGFDRLRINQYKAMIKRAKKDTDPAKKSSQLSQVYSQIRHDLLTTLGLDDIEKIRELTVEDQLNLSAAFGGAYFD